MRKKGAIGLSMNMLVVIILSIIVLAGGVALMYQFISGAEEQKRVLDSKTSAELERLLIDQGKMVALPLHKVALERGNSHLFGVGILNIGEGSGTDFSITVELSKAIDESDKEITGLDHQQIVDIWLLYDNENLIIEENEHRKEIISVDVPKEVQKGEYIFNVKVWHTSSGTPAGSQYGNTQKFYVKVI